MGEQVPTLILVTALSTLLQEALDRDEAHQLVTDRFKADLRALAARVENEIQMHTQLGGLRLVEDDSVSDD